MPYCPYVDYEWKLEKMILNFYQIANHKDETIGRVIKSCLHGWGIGKIFTIIVDNAASNDTVVAYLKRKIKV